MTDSAARLKSQLAEWRTNLLNLTRRNRLLYFTHTRSTTLELQAPHWLEIIERLESRERFGFFMPPEPTEDEEGNEVSVPLDEWPQPAAGELKTQRTTPAGVERSLTGLNRRATQEFMDKGLRVIYVGAPMLHWLDPDTAKDAFSPVLLFPVELIRKGPRAPFEVKRTSEDPVVNPTLALKLESEFDIRLPDEVVEDADTAAAIVEQVRELVGHAGWKVEDRAVLAPFTFHKEAMYRDLMDNEDAITSHPLIQAIVLGAEDSYSFEAVDEDRLDDEFPPEDAIAILDADATQRRCLVAAAQGETFVMDGPPGTGKSQTIANMIAASIADGRSVLFVSEKAAALDVVHKRLTQAHLDNFVLELHSQKATRKEVAQRLARALVAERGPGRLLDEESIARYRNRRVSVSSYAAAMNERRQPLGKTLNWALGRLAQSSYLRTPQEAPSVGADLTAAEYAAIIDLASALGRTWARVHDDDSFPWRGLELGEGLTTERSVEGHLGDLIACHDEIRSSLGELAADLEVPAPVRAADGSKFATLVQLLESRPPLVEPAWLEVDHLDEHRQAVERLAGLAESRHEIVAALVERHGDDVSAVPTRQSELIEIQSTLDSADQLIRVPPESDSADIRSISDGVETASGLLRAVLADASSLLDVFECNDTLTLRQLITLASAASVGDSVTRPPRSWIDPLYLPTVVAAHGNLAACVEADRSRTEAVSGLFHDSVMDIDIDIEDLVSRVKQGRRGLGRFSRQYRDDRDQLSGHSTSGKIRRTERRRFEELVAWVKARHHRLTEEQHHARVLGSLYLGLDTDLAGLADAVRVAQDAVDAADIGIPLGPLQTLLSGDSEPDSRLATAATHTLSVARTWEQTLGSIPVADLGDLITDTPLNRLVTQLAEVARACGGLTSILDEASSATRTSVTVADAVDLHDRLTTLAGAEQEFNVAESEHSHLIGRALAGLESDWPGLLAGLEWSGAMTDVLGSSTSAPTSQRLASGEVPASPIVEHSNRWTALGNALQDRFAEPNRPAVAAALGGEFDDVANYLASLHRSAGEIDVWRNHTDQVLQLREFELEHLALNAADQGVRSAEIPTYVERAVLNQWVSEVIESDKQRLRPLSAADRDGLVAEFKTLDRALKSDSINRVIGAVNQRRPRTTHGGPGIIKREGDKKRRHMPIRELLKRAGGAAQAVTPVFMMSPLAVSQFVPATMTFDVVIFDEASQIRPEDAINCIYRGEQVVIAGDQKQLPPSSFFQRFVVDSDDEWDEEELDEFESILDVAKGAGLPSLPLQWHYRSRHEHLIAYSNQAFYRGELLTFPGAIETDPSYGVDLIKVEGTYRRGTSRDNPEEAIAVAERVFFHATHHPDLTLGVVAFSEAQASRIEGEVDRIRQREPGIEGFFTADRLDGFFVKNLENVQGDERDIMIFSIGYGRDEVDRLTMNFGPLNKSGGERRLNVAITRARQRVEVVATIDADDFTDSNNPGVLHLKRYLDFAKRGPAALAYSLQESEGDAESPLEESVLNAVASLGYNAVPQVGVAGYRIDIGVRHPDRPGRFILAVECDGRAYHSSKVARDRDRLRQEVLEGLGWTVHRIWGPAWYRDRANQEDLLRGAIVAATEADSRPNRARVESPEPAPEIVDVQVDSQASWTRPYHVAHPKSSSSFEIHQPSSQAALREAILATCDLEAPIHFDLLVERLRKAWGLAGANKPARGAIEEAVQGLVSGRRLSRDRRRVIWRKGQQVEFVRVPGSDPESQRNAAQVPSEELAFALGSLVRDARVVDRDELSKAVSQLFGWARRGATVQASLDQAFGLLLSTDEFAEEEGSIRLRSRARAETKTPRRPLTPLADGDSDAASDRNAASTESVDGPDGSPDAGQSHAALAILERDLGHESLVLLSSSPTGLKTSLHAMFSVHDDAPDHECLFLDRSAAAERELEIGLLEHCLAIPVGARIPYDGGDGDEMIEALRSKHSELAPHSERCGVRWWIASRRPYLDLG